VNAPKALVADDDALIRMEACAILEDAGFLALDAGNADDALALLVKEQASVQLLFTDVEMPGSKDGFALAREVSRRWPHIGILVASGQRSPRVGDMPEGAHFIGKPFSADVVHGRVRELLPDGRRPEPLR
jgi:DNA-binding response OmpR family regulator